jgi:hypothetical protein
MDSYLKSMEEKDSKFKPEKKKRDIVKTPLKSGKLGIVEGIELTDNPMVCDPWTFLPRRE